ncbi:MAG: metalloregulator ArsR/SmtB family transcription factor [Peptoniphilus sp.]|nr:metalloregulator ArsR/SmtB family transcription factor [Peptoniphilus sp.]MDD7362598.1 metalloregulator ArsR/SmtB family transcription factor [Bacillota bacterium]MDY6045003.1 metalloregulator ArsR/SmtB family transcription factor [Peptoniphilus sp.]
MKDKFDEFVENQELIDNLSGIFKVMADPTRLKILYALMLSTCNVSKLVELLGMSQSSISHQLILLKNEGLIRSRKEGRKVYYSLDDEHVKTLFAMGYTHAEHKIHERD